MTVWVWVRATFYKNNSPHGFGLGWWGPFSMRQKRTQPNSTLAICPDRVLTVMKWLPLSFNNKFTKLHLLFHFLKLPRTWEEKNKEVVVVKFLKMGKWKALQECKLIFQLFDQVSIQTKSKCTYNYTKVNGFVRAIPLIYMIPYAAFLYHVKVYQKHKINK